MAPRRTRRQSTPDVQLDFEVSADGFAVYLGIGRPDAPLGAADPMRDRLERAVDLALDAAGGFVGGSLPRRLPNPLMQATYLIAASLLMGNKLEKVPEIGELPLRARYLLMTNRP